MKKINVLFVCLGNICRSPSAEAVMTALVKGEMLHQSIFCDSAGTSGYHDGETADPRSITHAQKRQYPVTSISRRILPEDFERFDYIIVMDDENLKDVKKLDPQGQYADKIFKMTDFCEAKKYTHVPDPYYKGAEGFEEVLDILEDSCHGLLKKIKTTHGF